MIPTERAGNEPPLIRGRCGGGLDDEADVVRAWLGDLIVRGNRALVFLQGVIAHMMKIAHLARSGGADLKGTQSDKA